MNQWVSAVIVAVVAATATIVAANISNANNHRNVRGRILQDLEIAEKLPDDSPAKEIIRTYAENRILLFPVENHIRYLGVYFLKINLLTVVVFGVYLALYAITRRNDWFSIGYPGLIGLGVWVLQKQYRDTRHKIIQQYLEDAHLSPSLEPKFERTVEKIANRWGLPRRWGIPRFRKSESE